MSRCDRSIVVDANLMRSAGGDSSTGQRPALCRDFLKTLLLLDRFCVVRTPDIYREWKRHWSRFARIWYVSMEARKKVLRPTILAFHEDVKNDLEAWAPSETERLAILKDAHLVVAALAADMRIASLDEALRSMLGASCANCSQVCDLLWTNPEIWEESAEEWLKNGAPVEASRTLLGHSNP